MEISKLESFQVLFVGPVHRGSTTEQRAESLRRLGHAVDIVTTEGMGRRLPPLAGLALRMGIPMDLSAANKAMAHSVGQKSYDLVWIDKGITIRPGALRAARQASPHTLFLSYSPDDMTIRPNATRWFRRSLPHYDLHVTTKRHNLEALAAWGARHLEFAANGYAPEVHRPMPRTAENRERLGGSVGFIGDYEEERARALRALAEAGLEVRIWGPNWDRHFVHQGAPLRVEGRGLYGDDYACAVCNFDINLAFLRRAASDTITTRSVEIPACGGFMLAERTQDHLDLFEEGVEAEFFDSDAELVDKCQRYLAAPDDVRAIGASGRTRCLNSGYSNDERIRQILEAAKTLER